MRSSIVAVGICFIAMTACSRGMCQDSSLATDFKRVTNATVKIFPQFAQPIDKDAATPILPMASGFFVSPTIIACSIHAIRGAGSLNVASLGAFRNRIEIRGLLACDTENDIALLSVDGAHEFLEFGKIAGDAEVPVFTEVGPRGYIASVAVRHTSNFAAPPAKSSGFTFPARRWPEIDAMLLTGPTPRDNTDFGMPVVDKAGGLIGVYANYISSWGEDWMLPVEPLAKLLASSKDATLMPLSVLSGIAPSKAERLGMIRPPDTNVVLGSNLQHTTLKGIRTVSILIEQLSDDIQKDGLDKDRIETDIELKLREAGIEVLRELKVNTPTFYVDVSSLISSSDSIYSYSLECELDDDVRMDNRNKNVVILSAPIWRSPGVIGTVGRDRVSKIRDTIKDQVDKFIVDFLKANPRR